MQIVFYAEESSRTLTGKSLKNVMILKLTSIFHGGLLYTAAYVRWDFFIGIISLRFAEDLLRTERQHRGKKAFYSIVSSNIPFSFTAISWGLVFILHTTPTFMLLPTHFFLEKGKYYILNAVL